MSGLNPAFIGTSTDAISTCIGAVPTADQEGNIVVYSKFFIARQNERRRHRYMEQSHYLRRFTYTALLTTHYSQRTTFSE